MKIPFTKMHGLGNDFVVIDAVSQNYVGLAEKAKLICDRRFGIGCDQLLVIRPSEIADFKMEIFNNDGSQVEMCGNGIRCVAMYVVQHGLTTQQTLAIETLSGIMYPRLKDHNLVEVDMGEPILDGEKIPTTMQGKVIQQPLVLENKKFEITCVGMGNPHCVIFVDKVDDFPVTEWGPMIEKHELFPNRVNVEFIEVLNNNHLKMRVWERGAGETLACGTGASAALVASVLTGHAQRSATLSLKGGDLHIQWSEKDNHVYMTGPGTEVYHGEIDI